MEITTNQFSTDPNVLVPLVRGGTVGGHSVIDVAADGTYTFVLCRIAGRDEFVTWSIWRTEEGWIAAGSGHYFVRLSDAVIDLNRRASRWDELERMRNQVVALLGP